MNVSSLDYTLTSHCVQVANRDSNEKWRAIVTYWPTREVFFGEAGTKEYAEEAALREMAELL